jgi:antitoxin ParD1/3/4
MEVDEMKNNTSVVLGEHYEHFLDEKIQSGRYGSKSEVIRAGLRLLEEHETRLNLLQRALIEGEESGTSDYSLQGLLAELDDEQLS